MTEDARSRLPTGITLKRDVEGGSFFFGEIFGGFANIEAVRSIFSGNTEKVLKNLRVDLQSRRGYLRIDDETGNVVVSLDYLRTGDERHLYLDVIHELIHIRQFMEGKELFDMKYSYLKRPTEIEAYAAAAEEAKRIGMGRDEIVDYLRVEWVTEDEFLEFLKVMGFEPKP